jgi:3-(3-hydroxy-phenyl)propionate hydroxylase
MDEVTQPCFRLVILEEKISENELLKINNQVISSKIKIIILKSDNSYAVQTESSSIEVIETSGIVRNWLNEAGCIGAIVRPDHYVYAGIVSSSKMADCMSALTSRLLQ